jgi:hypothetical protein
MFRTKALLSGIVTIALAGFLTACSRTEAPAAEAETAATPEATEAAPEATAPPAAAPANSVAANKTPAPAPAPKPASKPSAPKTPPASSSSASGWGDAPASTTPAAPVARTYTLPAGTSIKIRTTSTLSTKNQTTGETFAASLAEPLEVDGRVIAERGANVTGRIVNSDPGGRVKGKAMIQVALTGIQLVNGQSVSLSTNAFEQQADSSVKKDAAKVAIGSGIGAAIGAIAGGGKGAAIGAGVGAGAGTGTVLATRGNDAVIPAESLITFNTRSSVSVELR